MNRDKQKCPKCNRFFHSVPRHSRWCKAEPTEPTNNANDLKEQLKALRDSYLSKAERLTATLAILEEL